MKIFPSKMFTLVLLSIIKDSIDNQGESSFHTEKQKLVTFVTLLILFIINAFSSGHLIKLFISFSISV